MNRRVRRQIDNFIHQLEKLHRTRRVNAQQCGILGGVVAVMQAFDTDAGALQWLADNGELILIALRAAN